MRRFIASNLLRVELTLRQAEFMNGIVEYSDKLEIMVNYVHDYITRINIV